MDATECGYKWRHIATLHSVERGPRWVPPPGNCFKLNFDAAIFQELEASGFREVMVSISARGTPVIDSEEAEILACRKAL